jgi:hypothetical protein
MLKEDDSTWRFVAMEYHPVILKRTFVVTVTSTQICGARVRGLLASPYEPDPECHDPDLYARARLVDGIDIASEAYYRLDEADFQISLTELERVRFDASQKRGMRTVRNSGTLHLELQSGVTREFALLGSQDGKTICERLAESIRRARAS